MKTYVQKNQKLINQTTKHRSPKNRPLRKTSFTFFALLSLAATLALSACAKEQSAEEIKREQRVRDLNRNNPAAGHFEGYVQRADHVYVPIAVDNVVQDLNNGGGAQIQTSLTVGLFGGVVVQTTSTNYDHGTGLLTASFNRTNSFAIPGAKDQYTTLTFTVHILNKTVTSDGVLQGPNLSSFTTTGTLNVIFFKDQEKTLRDPSQVYTYDLSLNNGPVVGQLTMSRKLQGQEAPESVDLPLLPPLLASIQFDGTAAVSNPVSQVIYDPLRAHIDLVFGGSGTLNIGASEARLSADGIGLNTLNSSIVPKGFKGTITYQGGGKGTFSATLVDTDTNARSLKNAPPAFFRGMISGFAGNRTNRVSAFLDDQNQTLNNPPDFVFTKIPLLLLQVYLCNDGDADANLPLAEFRMSMQSFNQLTGEAVFTQADGGLRQFKAQVAPGWGSMKGTFTLRASSSAGAIPVMSLRATTLNNGVCGH